ncbi:MAG TPA: translational GTPase TypA [Planctomycetota bacterium]|nr:translational GTPase TypA [Planctomycetota bacterium]
MSAQNDRKIRNIAIIAHVDHGKSTLVDHLLRQAGTFRANQEVTDCVMDSNDLERERGITILAKNCAINYMGTRINIIDTPGHSDFGGEVERVLSMADGCCLLVDAAEGVLPQTKFVLRKAFSHDLRPIVVINKIDRGDARPHEVLNQVFDLFIEVGAHDRQLDFPHVFSIGREGIAKRELEDESKDLRPLFDLIMSHVPPPSGDEKAELRVQVANIDYNDYVGRIAIGRISQGAVKVGQTYTMISQDGRRRTERVTKLEIYEGLGRKEVPTAECGEIIALSGFEEVHIGDTLAEGENPEPLPPVPIDEPTLAMMFMSNNSPFSGQDGKYVTSRQVRDRLEKEALRNVAMKFEPTAAPDVFKVSGRGLLHLGVLIENMRREGYELQISKPHVIMKEENGLTLEPIESIAVDVPENFMGKVIELLGSRRCVMENMMQHQGHCHLSFKGPSRGLIGLRNKLLTATKGEAVLHHSFSEFGEYRGPLGGRGTGVQVASESGQVTGFALQNLQDRGEFFVNPGEQVYEGEVIGEHCKDNDIAVNVAKAKHLTNMRNANKENLDTLKSKRVFSLEEALEYIEDDELVEVTPKSIRLRKRLLQEKLRLKEDREKNNREERAA